MKQLTKAEEEVMRYLWKLKKGFLKDIVEQFPEPRPAYTTISTVIRTLVRKEFIDYNTYGKTHEYFPQISKESYFKGHIKSVVNNFFNGSISQFTSAFTDDKDVDLSDLQKMKNLIEERIKKLKEDGE